MILNHQCFKEIMKAEKRFTEDVQNEIVLCLYSFTTHPMTYNEEFIKVIKQIMFMYTNPNYSKRFEELKLLAKALRNIMKIKQRWALDIV